MILDLPQPCFQWIIADKKNFNFQRNLLNIALLFDIINILYVKYMYFTAKVWNGFTDIKIFGHLLKNKKKSTISEIG